MENTALNDIRLQTWEKKYPGCSDDFGKIFGTGMPSVKDINKWKQSWVENTPYQFSELRANSLPSLFASDIKSKIFTVTNRCRIHPYFWEFWQHQRVVVDKYNSVVTIFTPVVSFYNEEHLVMFKLAW